MSSYYNGIWVGTEVRQGDICVKTKRRRVCKGKRRLHEYPSDCDFVFCPKCGSPIEEIVRQPIDAKYGLGLEELDWEELRTYNKIDEKFGILKFHDNFVILGQKVAEAANNAEESSVSLEEIEKTRIEIRALVEKHRLPQHPIKLYCVWCDD